jgi:hypothetical protein
MLLEGGSKKQLLPLVPQLLALTQAGILKPLSSEAFCAYIAHCFGFLMPL